MSLYRRGPLRRADYPEGDSKFFEKLKPCEVNGCEFSTWQKEFIVEFAEKLHRMLLCHLHYNLYNKAGMIRWDLMLQGPA